jgi:hypothetical protein
MVSYVSLNIHLHDTLHHTFAFINIHLDIHRIIIIITYTLASALKEKASEKREKRCWGPSASEGPQKHNLTTVSK